MLIFHTLSIVKIPQNQVHQSNSKLILQHHARVCIAIIVYLPNWALQLCCFNSMTWWRVQRKYGQGHGLQTKQVQCQSVTWGTGSTASTFFINNVGVSASQSDHHIHHAHPNSHPNASFDLEKTSSTNKFRTPIPKCQGSSWWFWSPNGKSSGSKSGTPTSNCTSDSNCIDTRTTIFYWQVNTHICNESN